MAIVSTLQRVAEDHAMLDGTGREIHVFEVYWADLLWRRIVKKTFDFNRIFEVVWFPLSTIAAVVLLRRFARVGVFCFGPLYHPSELSALLEFLGRGTTRSIFPNG